MTTYLTIQQAAALLGVSDKTIRRRIETNKLKAHRIGEGPKSHLRVTEEDVLALLTRNPTA